MTVSFRGRLVACLLLLVVNALSLAHDSLPPGPPPPPPPPARHIEGDPIPNLRWTWYHWWEANRDRYIWPDRLDQGDIFLDMAAIDKDRATFRASTVEALMGATHGKFPALRAMAAVSLGRMREPTAVKRLKEMLGDNDEDVRRAAMIGLALIDTAPARDALLALRDVPLLEEHALLISLGLTRSPEPRVRTRLTDALDKPPHPADRTAAWALARRDDADAGFERMAETLLKTEDPWIASDAILALGHSGRPQYVKLLASILMQDKNARSLSVWKYMTRLYVERQRFFLAAKNAPDLPTQRVAMANGYAVLKTWLAKIPNRYDEPKDQNPSTLHQGIEKLYLSRLRVSAAIALGNINQAESRAALAAVVAAPDEDLGDDYRGMAIISLGKIGDDRTLPQLARILSPYLKDGSDVLKPQDHLDSPMRGYAAIALGLQLRGSAPVHETEFSATLAELCRILAQTASNSQDTIEVRSACVLALGLSRHPLAKELLQKIGDTTSLKDEPLFGYWLLARGMVGDQDMITPAWNYLADTPDRIDHEGILGRRAAVLGLGLLRSQRGVLLMKKAWELNYYVSREVAFGLSICGDHQVTPVLIDMLHFSEKPLGSVFAAEVLGKLFEMRKPYRTAWLVNGSNYMIRNDEIRPYRKIGNEFLFEYMIKAFDEQWW